MKVIHFITDEKFLNSTIELFEEIEELDNRYINIIFDEDKPYQFITSDKVEKINISDVHNIITNPSVCDVIVIHNLSSLPCEQIMNIDKKIKDLMDLGYEKKEVIFLREVDSFCLEKIIEYLKHYKYFDPKEIPKPFPERTDDAFLRGILNDDWTFDFLQQMGLEELFNLVNSADYLQIQGLINIIAAKLAHEMCNCEIEEARKKFGIECDMTEEEIAEIDKYPLD